MAGLLAGDRNRSAWEKQQTDFGAAKSGKKKYLGRERMPMGRHGCTEQSAW